MKYLLIIENAGDNLCAYFPDVPGCVTVGDTVDEIRRNAADALALHLEDESDAPIARSLREILDDKDVELDGSEVLAWLSYEHGKSLVPV